MLTMPGTTEQQKHIVRLTFYSLKDILPRIEARVREKYLKSGVGKEFLKTLLHR